MPLIGSENVSTIKIKFEGRITISFKQNYLPQDDIAGRYVGIFLDNGTNKGLLYTDPDNYITANSSSKVYYDFTSYWNRMLGSGIYFVPAQYDGGNYFNAVVTFKKDDNCSIGVGIEQNAPKNTIENVFINGTLKIYALG